MTDREILELLLQKVTGMESKMANMEYDIAELKRDSQAIKQAVMETVDTVVDDQQDNKVQIQVLNSRLFAVEAKLERLSNQ